MNRSFIVIAFVISAAPGSFAQDTQPALKDQKDKVSYSIGLDIGGTFKKQSMDINPEALVAGLKDALSGAKPRLTDDQIKETMTTFQKDMEGQHAAKVKEAGSTGEKFLAENKGKDGVKTTATGLQYKVLKEGNGPMPKETDTVEVNYRGTLLNGTEFDSSYKRGQTATFPVNRVIKGWTEALQLMKAGSKYQLFIPANLAYGERGAGGDIGPNETLIFEVELIGIKPSAGSKPAAEGTPTATPK